MATTEKTVKKLTIHKMKKSAYNALSSKSADEIYLLTDVGGQVSEISEASADYVGEIVQYVGETNDTYTNGFFYKCIETDGVYSWTQVNVQEGGGSGLPDQTDNGGKFLATDGTTVSWSENLYVGNNYLTDSNVFIGNLIINRPNKNSHVVSIGANSQATRTLAIAIGFQAKAGAAGAVQLGQGQNNTANTLQFQYNTIIDANGNVPLERLTYVTNQIGDISTALTAILGE